MARGGQPNEVAMTAVFLASDEAAYISGTDILGKLNSIVKDRC